MKTPLEESIEHWTRLATGNREPNEVFGSDDCALCQEHYDITAAHLGKNPCIGCPIREKTRHPNCNESPFDKIRELDKLWFGKPNPGTIEELMDTPEFKAAALIELEFLKSLLPTK